MGKRTEEAIIAWIELRITPPSDRPTPEFRSGPPERSADATLEPLTLVIRRSSSTPIPTKEIATHPRLHEEQPTRAPNGSEEDLSSNLKGNSEGEGVEALSSHQAPLKPTKEDHQVDDDVDEGEDERNEQEYNDDEGSDEDEEYIVSFDGTELLLWTWFAPERTPSSSRSGIKEHELTFSLAKGTVLFLHDLGMHCAHQAYLTLYELAHKQGMTVYCFDLRGHGGSEGIRGT